MMREFNELPHAFDARIHASRDDANRYTEEFPAPLVTLVAGFVTFIVSSLVGVLLALSLINENILLFSRLPEADGDGWGFNLLWWLAMASTLLAVSRSFSTHSPRTTQPDALLRGVAQHTHYMPDHWRRRGYTRDVYLEFARSTQLIILLQEFLGCVTTPILLIFVMPFRAAEILEFVRTFTVHVEGVGHVCSFALFDFARHGDVRYGAPVDAPKSQRSRDGKMEQAYLNFKSQHPTWRANDDAGDAGDALLHTSRRATFTAASRRARHAHAAAAPAAAAGGRAAARRARRRRRRRRRRERDEPGARARRAARVGGAPGAALGATLGGTGSAAIGALASQLLLLARSSRLHPPPARLARRVEPRPRRQRRLRRRRAARRHRALHSTRASAALAGAGVGRLRSGDGGDDGEHLGERQRRALPADGLVLHEQLARGGRAVARRKTERLLAPCTT